jgi:hypothetical protein
MARKFREVVESNEGVGLVLLLEEKGRDLSYHSVVDIRVEWLCSLSGGVLRFAPSCTLAGLEPSFWGSCLCLPPQHSKKLSGRSGLRVASVLLSIRD